MIYIHHRSNQFLREIYVNIYFYQVLIIIRNKSQIIHSMTTSNTTQQSRIDDEINHCQQTIFPQKLIQTEQRLVSIEDKLKHIISSLSQQRKRIETKKRKEIIPNSTVVKQVGSESFPQLNQDKERGNCQKVNAVPFLKEDKQKLIEQQQRSSAMNCKQTKLAQDITLEWLQFWILQDQIFLQNKSNHERSIAFYEEKIRASQKMYSQMKEFYLKKIQEIQKVENIYAVTYNSQKQQLDAKNVEDLQKTGTILQKCSNLVTISKEQVIKKDNSETKIPGSQFSKQQFANLQNIITQLKNENNQLKEKLQNQNSKVKQLQNQITTLSMTSQGYCKQVSDLKMKTQEKDAKIKQILENMSHVQQKLQEKQKQIIKAVHSESNFAAQQLVNLQVALVRQKEEYTALVLSYTKKIEDLQQKVRQFNFNSEKDHIQINLLKDKLEQITKQKQTLQGQIDKMKAEQQREKIDQIQTVNVTKGNQLQIKQTTVQIAQADNINQRLETLHPTQLQTNINLSGLSCNSVASIMKKSYRKLKIIHEVDFQIKKAEIQPTASTKQKENQRNLVTEEKKTSDIFDILFEDEGEPAGEKDQDFKFTRVVSVKSNEPYDTSKSDQDPQLNMDVMGEILLIPVDSLDQIQIGLEKLRNKLIEFKKVLHQKDQKQLIKDKKAKPKEEDIQENWNQALQNELKITGFPAQNNKVEHTIEQKSHKDKNQSTLQKLNKDIYEFVDELGELCKAIKQNFEQKIIQYQPKQTIQKIQSTNLMKLNSKNETQKKIISAQTQKKEEFDLNKQNPVMNKNTSLEDKNLENQQKIQHPILESREDYNKILKIINNEIKKVFLTFFNDSKILSEEDQRFSEQHIKCNLVDDTQIQELKQEDQKSTLDILSKISGLQSELSKKRTQIFQRNKERIQRLLDVIRSMIITFKISHKSMNKIIEAKEMIGSIQHKYMLLRHYLASLYKVMEQQFTARNEGLIDNSNNSQNTNLHQDSNSTTFTLYDNYEQKLEKLSSQLSKVRLQLDYKNQQYQQLKQASVHRLQIPENVEMRQTSRSDRSRSRKQSQQIPQLNYKLDKSLKKDHIDERHSSHIQKATQNKNNKSIQELKNELSEYKKRCLQYEQKLNQNGNNLQNSSSGKKKTQKIIYIRR